MNGKEISITESETITEGRAIAAFTAKDGLDDIVQQVAMHIRGYEHDLTTGAGRKRTASLSAKVSKTKTALDALGKSLTDEMKQQCKVVDNSRKAMRDELDKLRDEARKPLTDWEAEEAEKIEQEAIKAEANRLAEQKESDHEIGLLLNEKFDRDAEEVKAEAARLAKAEADRIEVERIEYEAELKRRAVEQAEKDKDAAIKREQIAKQAQIDAETARVAAESRAVEAEKQAQIDAENAAENARLAEVARQDAEAARIADDQARREANKRHVGNVRRKIKEHVMAASGIDEATAKKVVLCLHSIDEITVNY